MKQPTDRRTANAEAAQAEERLSRRPGEYTLKVVFSGILPLVPQYDGRGTPKTFWVLVPDLTRPDQLPNLPGTNGNGHHAGHLHPHHNRLLFRRSNLVSAGSREVKRGEVCGRRGSYEYVTLSNEHLTLEADTRDATLAIVRGPIVPPNPCIPGSRNGPVTCNIRRSRRDQERDIQWTVDLDGIVRHVTRDGAAPPRLQKSLFDAAYAPAGPRLLAARFAFDRGEVASHRLDREVGQRRYARYIVPVRDGDGRPIFNQAVATEIQLELRARGPVTFRSRALDGSGDTQDPVVLCNRGRRTVVVVVDNNPTLPCGDVHRTGPHFHLNYHLLDRPDALRSYPGPIKLDGDSVYNAQCSPPRAAYPG